MIAKRGNTYHFDSTIGGRRVRASLGTADKSVASRLAGRVSCALVTGEWGDLKTVLPPASYRSLASGSAPDLAEFEKLFVAHLQRRRELKQIAESTHHTYLALAMRFFEWLRGQSFRIMEKITPSVIQQYQVARQEQIAVRPQTTNGRGLQLDIVVLRLIFRFAVEEGFLKSSPVKPGGASYGEAKSAEPFTPEEMEKLEEATQGFEELFLFRIFRWTGLRCSDVADLRWGDFDMEAGLLRRKTLKRGKTVAVPLVADLLEDLRLEHSVQHPLYPTDYLFVSATRAKLFSVIRNLGRRAGVEKCHPHRFRHTFSVTILERGGTIYDVAKILGDTVATVEKHYAPFTDRLQERVRKILDLETPR
jgi:integrase